MKKFGLLIFLLVSLSSCNNNKALDDLISQNNKLLSIQLEEYILELEQRGMDNPQRFENYYLDVKNSFNATKKLKKRNEYDSILKKIKKLESTLKTSNSIAGVDSDNLEILKNNLYLNLVNIIHEKKINASLHDFTDFKFSPYFKLIKKKVKDSTIVDILTYNTFNVSVDAVSDGKENLKYNSQKQYKIWSIKYKSKSNNSYCTGKIFLTDQGKVLMAKEFDDRKALDENPFK